MCCVQPDNIFLSRNRRVLRLGDLGIAKALEGTLQLAITCTGTPYYMSPGGALPSRALIQYSIIWM